MTDIVKKTTTVLDKASEAVAPVYDITTKTVEKIIPSSGGRRHRRSHRKMTGGRRHRSGKKCTRRHRHTKKCRRH